MLSNQLRNVLGSFLPVASSATCTRLLSSGPNQVPPALWNEEITAASSSDGDAAPAEATAIVLHGLLGSGRNWRSFARRLVTEAKSRDGVHLRVLLVDLRNHGASSTLSGLHPPHSVESAAHDVIRLMQQRLPKGSAPFALLGHSLGGKVAMETLRLLEESQQPVPRQTWVLDSQPGTVSAEVESKTGVAEILKMVHEIPLPVPTRQVLLDDLRKRGLSEATALWLGSSLVPDARGKLGWAFNVQGAAAMYHSYCSTDLWSVLERPPDGTEVHLVQGALSERWTPDMIQRLEAAAASNKSAGGFFHHVLEGAGHNLHAENPSGLQELMLKHMNRAWAGLRPSL